jgi:hypothetical protein
VLALGVEVGNVVVPLPPHAHVQASAASRTKQQGLTVFILEGVRKAAE